MKNTGITYTSAERSPVILPEMAELLPPLSAEQSAALEEDLLRNGCYSPIIVNEDMVIVDGHNRQALCEKYELMEHPAIRYTIDGGGPPYIHHGTVEPPIPGKPLFQIDFDNEKENAAA